MAIQSNLSHLFNMNGYHSNHAFDSAYKQLCQALLIDETGTIEALSGDGVAPLSISILIVAAQGLLTEELRQRTAQIAAGKFVDIDERTKQQINCLFRGIAPYTADIEILEEHFFIQGDAIAAE